jgi:hypothetical protein
MAEDEQIVTVTLRRADADRIFYGMADLLCWAVGFCAGTADSTLHPMGLHETRSMRDALRRGIEAAGATEDLK